MPATKILIVNPNTTVSMTETIGAAALPTVKNYAGLLAPFAPKTSG